MKKLTWLILAALLLVIGLGAEEVALRQSYELNWDRFHFRTSDNSEIVFWSDTPSADRDVFAQKINPNGQTIWNEPLPMTTSVGDQRLLDVVPSSDNCFILLWEEYDIDTLIQLGMQKVTSNGQRLWGETGVLLPMGNQYLQKGALVPNNVGGAYVIFRTNSNNVMGQNIDALGNQLWQTGGIQLFIYTGSVNLQDAVSDGEGGAIINIQKDYNTSHLMRISDTGTVIGNSPLLPPAAFPGYKYSLMSGKNGQFILWNYANPNIRFRKMDNQGNLLTPVSNEYNLGENYSQLELANTPEGGLILAWMREVYLGTASVRIQKFDADFVPQWQTEGTEISTPDAYDPFSLSLAVHDNGNAWISWSEGLEPPLCKAQLVSPAGVPLWESGGKTLGQGYGQPLSVGYPDRGMFVWNTRGEGLASIRRQVISTGGALFLETGGALFVQRLCGQAYVSECVALNDRFLTVWCDDRQNTKLYYQINDTNLQPQLALNGVVLNPYPSSFEFLGAILRTEISSATLVYGIQDGDNFMYYLQQISANGNKLYPERGLYLFTSAYNSKEIYIGMAGGDIYLGWNNYDIADVCQIKAQRISNGQLMWEEGGKTIASVPHHYSCGIQSVQGSYYQWGDRNPISLQTHSKVLRVDTNGNPVPGWDVAGVNLVEGTNSSYLYVNYSGLHNGDFVSFMNIYQSEGYINRGQRISSEGQRMWSATGVNLGSGYIQNAVFGTEMAYILNVEVNDANELRFQKINPDGELLLSPEGNLITPDMHYSYDGQLLRFADGSYLCAWTANDGAWIQNRDVFTRQIDPSGQPMGSAPTVFCGARYQQSGVRTAAIGNKAMLAWSDDRAGIINSEVAITGVWANTFTSSYVATDDPIANVPLLTGLQGNYPNPFNPNTTIRYSMQAAGKVTIVIYNLKGQMVHSFTTEHDSPGLYQISWDGRDMNGRPVSSGIYMTRMSSGKHTSVKKMILAK